MWRKLLSKQNQTAGWLSKCAFKTRSRLCPVLGCFCSVHCLIVLCFFIYLFTLFNVMYKVFVQFAYTPGFMSPSPQLLSHATNAVCVSLTCQCVCAYVLWWYFTWQSRVLHNLMPIFTFMGASILRQDNQYSFQVINTTLDTIIPVLVKVVHSKWWTLCATRGSHLYYIVTTS